MREKEKGRERKEERWERGKWGRRGEERGGGGGKKRGRVWGRKE